MKIYDYDRNYVNSVVSALNKTYPYGDCAFVGTDDRLFKELLKSRRTVVFKPGEAIPDKFRYVIAVGKKAVLYSRSAVKDRYLYSIPDLPEPYAFSDIAILGYNIAKISVRETVFIGKALASPRAADIARQTLFLKYVSVTDSVLAMPSNGKEALRELLYEAVFFSDSAEKSVAAAALFYKAEAVAEIDSATDYIASADEIAKVPIQIEAGFYAYFILLLLLQFTKVRKNVILIGADRLTARTAIKWRPNRVEVASRPGRMRGITEERLPTADEVSAMARAAGVIDKAETESVINNILIACEAGAPGGAIAELVATGYIEGLKNAGKN